MIKKNKIWPLIYVAAFACSFIASVIFKFNYKPSWAKDYSTKWDFSVGTVVKDIPYGKLDSNTFDLYLPADSSKPSYGLVVYIHAGGFTSGDKSDDSEMLKWLCSLGYVSCGINYTLFSEEHPDANVYTQSVEIRDSMPYVIAAAKERGYDIDEMAISGGSAGGCLALLYAYRDCDTSPVPVKMVFEGVGPSSFYPEDWGCFGFDKNKEAAAGMFSVMAGKTITPDMFGTPEYDELMKDISALYWINEDTVPTVLAYGVHDRMQSYPASIRLNDALDRYSVKHEYYVMPHSGHGLQNDSKIYRQYMDSVKDYLNTYLPVR